MSAHTSAAKAIAERSRRDLPQSVLVASGRALYSPAATLTSGSPIYFLGLNPGELPDGTEFHDLLTVGADLARLEDDRIDLHGYLDERWKDNSPGQAPIQVAALGVFALLAGGDINKGRSLLRSSPTSNFVLPRSPSEAVLEARTGQKSIDLAMQCWPFHEAVLRESGCEVILTHAIGIARKFAQRRGLGDGWQRDSGWGGTLNTLYAWDIPGGPRLLAMPNLSRYKPGGARSSALARFFREFGPTKMRR